MTYSPREFNGITEEKILAETNIETLLGWKEEINGVSMDIKLQLNRVKAKRGQGLSYDVDWYWRATGKVSVLGYLSQVIQNTIGILNKRRHEQRESKREVLFIKVCREVLEKDEYKLIWEKVDELTKTEV